MFTSEELAHSNPELVEKFRRASIKGWEYALDNPEEIIEKISEEFNNDELRNAKDFEDYNRHRQVRLMNLYYIL